MNMLHPCPTWNHVNSFGWYKENSFVLDEDPRPKDRLEALKPVLAEDRHPVPQGAPLAVRPLPVPGEFAEELRAFE